MSWGTRLRQPSSKFSCEDYVMNLPKGLTKLTREQNTGTKKRSTKGSSEKLDSCILLSPVLRDRTNLINEPTTNIVLKKGPRDNKNAAHMKVIDEEKIKQTRVIKSSKNEDTEKFPKIRTRSKQLASKINKGNNKIPESNIPKVSSMEKLQEIRTRARVKRDLVNQIVEEKVSTSRTKVTRKNPAKKNDNADKMELVSKKLSKDELKLSGTRKTIVNQLNKRSPNKVKHKTTCENNEKKFFKSKLKPPTTTLTHSKISPLKHPVIGKTTRTQANQKNVKKITTHRPSTSFTLRQITISESFAKLPKKVLRSRKIPKNYCEETKLSDKIDNENKLTDVNEKKGPVYKLKKNTNESGGDKEKVYEFTFDRNDSKERATQKRKKKTIRRAPTKKAKKAVKEAKSNASVNTKAPETKKTEPTVKIIPEPPVIEIQNVDAEENENNDTTITVEIHASPIKNSEELKPMANETKVSITKTNTSPAPRIISNIELKDDCCIGLTVTPVQSRSNQNNSAGDEHAKLNSKSLMQLRTMMNASLLRRSLSPITHEVPKEKKATMSPWQVPSINKFSRVKNVFQSTPQSRRFITLLDKASNDSNLKQKSSGPKMDKITEHNDENANISPIKKSPRKFGTVISNMTNTSPSKRPLLPQANISKSVRKLSTAISDINESTDLNINERTKSSTNSKLPAKYNSIDTSISNIHDVPPVNETLHDKENLVPIKESSQKSPTKRINAPQVTPPVSKNIQETLKNKSEVIVEPQPGPSGIQKSSPLEDTQNLKQSNLNKFLSIPDMPDSTHISTSHGIFDDIHSTPIVGKQKKKITTEFQSINNAFGFDDDVDEIDVSPIVKVDDNSLKVSAVPAIKKLNIHKIDAKPRPIRLCTAKPIDKITHRKNDKKKVEKVPIDDDNLEITAKKEIIQAIDFSDTFDTLTHENDDENIEEIPLFVDIEPVHFTKPPRYSYAHKRKRNTSMSTHENSEDEKSEEHHNQTKKKKIGKAEREQKKKLNEWAKNINSTFDEIDHFDLIVE